MSRRDDRGQATVELALVLPIVVLLLAGVVWVGQLMATQVRLIIGIGQRTLTADVSMRREDLLISRP